LRDEDLNAFTNRREMNEMRPPPFLSLARPALLGVWLALAGQAHACGVILDPDHERALQRKDVRHQADMAAALAEQADHVFVGVPMKTSASSPKRRFRVERTLKGEAVETVDIIATPSFTLGCSGSDGFRNVYTTDDERHIVYVRDGTALRVAAEKRGARDLSLRRELRALRARLRS
jgi:hypothetical protein